MRAHKQISHQAALSGLASGLAVGVLIGAGAMLEAAPANMLPLDNRNCPEETVVRNATVILT